MNRRPALAALALCAAVALAGCESTQDESARLKREAKALLNAPGQTVTQGNPLVKVLDTAVLHDHNGTAAVVSLRSSAARPLVQLPIEIQVTDAHGQALFKNDASGLEQSLTQVPLLLPGQPGYWVNDQVIGGGAPTAVKATVGVSKQAAPQQLPKITLSGVKLTDDPVNGPEAVGTVRNDSPIQQIKLTIYCVAIKGGRVVAAGRAGIPILPPAAKASKPTHFAIFFIGDPRGAQLVLSAPPTTLR